VEAIVQTSIHKLILVACLSPSLLWAQTTPQTVPERPNGNANSSSAVPNFVRFSGSASSAAETTTSVRFALYADQQGGSPLWLETQNISPDATGHYSVLLGSASKDGLPADLFASAQARWLGITVGDGPEQARVLLVSVPYALKAGDAETLGGLPASAFVQNASVVTAGTTAPSTATSSNASYINSRPAKAAITASISGTGTAGKITKWMDGAGTLADSSMYDTGSKVGINNIAPVGFMDVATDGGAGYIALTPSNINLYDKGFLVRASRGPAGSPSAVQSGDTLFNLYAQGYYGSDYGIAGGIAMTMDGNPTVGGITPGRLQFYTSSPTENFLERMRIDSQGRVGIGTTGPGNMLTVAGTIESTTDGAAGYIILSPSNINLYDKGFLVRASRGAKATPSAVQSGDNLFNLYAHGYDGSNYQIAGGISMSIDGAVSSGVAPGRLQFYTSGTSASFQERMRIDSQGRVGIGTATPTNPLTVNGVIQSTTGGFMFPDGTSMTSAAAVQTRVTGTCAAGSAMQGVNADGSVMCVAVAAATLPTGFNVFGTSPTASLAGYSYSGNYAVINGAAWDSTFSTMPEYATNFASAVFGGNIYVFGLPDGSNVPDLVYKLDTTAGTWTAMATMPTPRGSATAVSYGTNIYVFGGASKTGAAQNACEIYVPATNTWLSGTLGCLAVPTASAGMSGTAIPATASNPGIYLFGGGSGPSTQALRYNVTTNTYDTLTNLPTGVWYSAAAYTNNTIYVLGGIYPAHSFGSTLNQAYNPATNSYASKSVIPDNRADTTAMVSSSGSIYIFGDALGTNLTVWSYDPLSDTYLKFPQLPRGRLGGGAGILTDGRVVVFGGSTDDVVDVFHPDRVQYEFSPN
jgi:N-acetylneuraminic acid mutarotase